MNTISSHPRFPTVYGNVNNNDSMDQAGLKSFEQKSVTTSRNENLDLFLKTREGDTVTIQAASFSELDSFTYNETGQMSNGDTSVTSRVSYRTMTLETGSSFTFSVNGDLNDQELDDIEKLVGSLDKVLGKMASGDMDGAVESALGMTGYESVSSFSADLTMQRSYTMVSELSQESYSRSLPPDYPSALPGLNEIDKLMERMVSFMDPVDEKIQKKSRQPVDQLFSEHLKAIDRSVHGAGADQRSNKGNDMISRMMTDFRQRMQAFFDTIS